MEFRNRFCVIAAPLLAAVLLWVIVARVGGGREGQVADQTLAVFGYDAAESGIVKLPIGTQDPVALEAPEGTVLLNQRASPDGASVYFSVASPIGYRFGTFSYTQQWDFAVAFRYDVGRGVAKPLFTADSMPDTGFSAPQRYMFVRDVSGDGSLAAYSVNQCFGCDAPSGGTLVYRSAAGDGPEFQVIGDVFSFRFTGDRTFEYVEKIEVACPEEPSDIDSGNTCYGPGEIRSGEL
jgi:hypothetical protein